MTHARIRSSIILATVIMLVVGLGYLGSQPGSSQAASTTRPIIFGAAAATKSQVLDHERVLGRHMEGVRVYKDWDDSLLGSELIWMRDTGHTPFLSIKARRNGGSYVKFSAIATAAPGSTLYRDMQRMAAQIKSYRAPIYIIFQHEPEEDGAYRNNGNGPAFAAAFRKFVTVMRASGVTNAKYVATFTGWGFKRKDTRNVAKYYYPGDAYVDAVAIDVYNWAGCRGDDWKSMAFLIEPLRQWGRAHPSEKLMLLEWGTVEDRAVPGRKAQWIKDAQALFKQPGYEQFSALLQWGGRNYAAKCPFDYVSSASATAAWAAMGRDAAYTAG